MNKTTLSFEDLNIHLNNLLECDALELVSDSAPDSSTLYIPYMINDALEYYFILENCQLTGAFSKKLPSDTTFKLISATSANQKNALIFYPPNGEVLTIWFSSCSQVIEYYQYHRIGHFWRKGEEHWRRLVYIVGTLHEKYSFLGSDSCNDQELKLLQLMGFAPFRYWSPIHESLDDYYQNSPNGLFFMHQFALETGDTSYARWIRLYRRFPFPFMEKLLAKKLLSPKREALYQLIQQKINDASEPYAQRDYGTARNAEIKKIRRQFSEKLYADGFVGQYPEFRKDETYILAVEEHPFTISELEYENFDFRIHGLGTERGVHFYRAFADSETN